MSLAFYVNQIEKLQEENQRLRKALEYYADKENWLTTSVDWLTAQKALRIKE